MKGIIRKTGEEVTIVDFHSRPDRNETLDYVSYIDSHGEEHSREKLNLYWDIEVINESFALAEQQAKNAALAVECSKKSSSKMFTKREFVSLNIYTAIVNGIYSKAGSNHWTPQEVSDLTENHVAEFMKRFIEEETK